MHRNNANITPSFVDVCISVTNDEQIDPAETWWTWKHHDKEPYHIFTFKVSCPSDCAPADQQYRTRPLLETMNIIKRAEITNSYRTSIAMSTSRKRKVDEIETDGQSDEDVKPVKSRTELELERQVQYWKVGDCPGAAMAK